MDNHARSCDWCQATSQAASRLRFKKLGKHERRQLLQAGSPRGSPATIVPPAPSQAAQTATRRAVRNLRDCGLITVAPNTVRITEDNDRLKLLPLLKRKYAVMRLATRTALGEAVVEHYRTELEGGSRIRWPARLDAVTEAALARCPHR